MATFETTNDKLSAVLEALTVLEGWAEADAQHSRENDAHTQAKDDARRVRTIRRAHALLMECTR